MATVYVNTKLAAISIAFLELR